MYIIFVQVWPTGGQNSNYLLSVACRRFCVFEPRDSTKKRIAGGAPGGYHSSCAQPLQTLHVVARKFCIFVLIHDVARGRIILETFAHFVILIYPHRILGPCGPGRGRRPMAEGRWPKADGRWPMADGRWPMADGRWPDGRWPRVQKASFIF